MHKAGRRYLALLAVTLGVLSGFGATSVAQAARAPRLLTTLTTPTLTHTVPTPYVLNGGHPGSYAWGVATLPDGTVAVGDIFNNRVLHYDTSGNLLGVLFKTTGLGANPYGLAVDPNDWTIYAGSAQCCGVQVWTTSTTGSTLNYTHKTTIDPTGGPTSTTSRYPARLAVGGNGTVYVADMTLNTISAFSSQASGNVKQFQFGSYGTGPAQFKQPRGMAVDGSSPQRLYVIDSGNFRVEVFDTSQMSNPSTHGYIYSMGATGTNPYNFGGNLRGLAYDTNTNLMYVVDMGKNHTEVFHVNPTATTNPAAPYGWVENIGKADPNNATLTTCCAQPGMFSDGGREDAVDGLGHLWVADMPNFRTQVWSIAGTHNTFLFDAPSATSPLLPAPGQFSYPEGVGVAGDGTIVVSDSHNFRLEWFNSATGTNPYALDTAAGVSGQEGLRGRQNDYSLNYSRNLVFNTNTSSAYKGDFYLADTYNNSVHGFSKNGTALWVYGGNGTGGIDTAIHLTGATSTVKSPLTLPSGVAVDNTGGPNGNDIYIADSGGKRVVVISPTGTLLATFTITQFKDPRGLAVDPGTGDLYVADFSGATIYRFTISGVWGSTATPGSATLVKSVSTSASAGTGSSPFDIVVDPANPDIYVSDTSLGKILTFNSSTLAYVGAFAITGQPEGISMSPGGDLYIASRSNDKILVYCNPTTGTC
jgi:tripartite motif-containing protein 71